nr:unnamed protein product [Callosobruchus chinensis]
MGEAHSAVIFSFEHTSKWCERARRNG